MSEKRGIFSLEEFYDLQLSGETTDIFDPYIYVKNSTNFGYFGGGSANTYHSSPNISSIYKVDYSNDNPTEISSFSLALSTQTATGNSNFAYFAGGTQAPSPLAVSNVYRLDYGNDSATPLSKGPLSVYKNRAAATGNLDFGYISGDGFLSESSIDRLDYANDSTTATPKGNLLNNVNWGHAGLGNLNHGYFIGGWGDSSPFPYSVSTVQKLDYSNDSAALSPKGPLWYGNHLMGSMGNADYGWYTGGVNYYNTFLSRTARIDYANDTGTSSIRAYLPTETGFQRGHGNSTQGYTVGGYQPSYGFATSSYKIDYANDTSTASPANGVPSRYYVAATSPLGNGFPTTAPLSLNGVDKSAQGIPSTFGYFAGGFLYDNSSRSSSTCRIDFSNDTSALGTKGALFSNEHSECDGESNSNHGYIIGGSMPSTLNPSPSYRTQSTISRIDFANDTATATRAGNFWYRQYTVGLRATGNNDFAYFIASNPSSNVSRLDYSNDNAGTIERGNITYTDVYQGAAAGNLNFGYFTKYTRVERIDYSNDLAASVTKGPLSSGGSYYGAGVGNGNFGYFVAGQPSSESTIISRLDYSNDSAQGLPKGNLAERRRQFAGTGDSNFGYYGGGTNNTGPLNSYLPSASILSSTTRIDYANDTNTTSPKGNLTATSYGGTRALSATSSSDNGKTAGVNLPRVRFIDNQVAPSSPSALYNFGYFSGGIGSTSINRIDFANDTGTIPDRGSLTAAKRDHYAVGNQNFGYFAGGEDALSNYPTSVDRIDYANDNVLATPKGPLNSLFRMGNGTGNLNYGYLAGDFNGYPYGSSIVQRIDYANDTSTASNKGPLTYTAWGIGACGTLDFGFFSGGLQGNANSPSQNYQTIARLDYSNETIISIANMNSQRARHGAVGNGSYGYCIAGHPSFYNTERINYSNSTITTNTLNGNTGQFNDGGATGNNDFGYYGGGGYPSNVTTFPSTVRRVDYANDTSSPLSRCNFPDATPSYSSNPKLYAKRAVSALINGYPAITSQDGLPPYSSFNFPVQNYNIPTTGHGYFAGSPGRSSVNRIDYANDSATAATKGNLPSVANLGGGAGNQSYGYTMGGYDGNSWDGASTVYRVDYANDTGTPTTKGPLSAGRKYVDSIGNNSYGYTSGGYPSFNESLIDRITYANDTNTATSLGNIFSIGDRATATAGNLNYGYFGGGSGSFPRQSTVTRLDYANDTAPTSPRGPLNNDISDGTAVGNANYGYWQLRYPGSTHTKLDRVDYSNDTATALPKGNLTATGYRQRATGNPNYGYFAGGYVWPNTFSTIQRINYNNDTVIASPKGPLSYIFQNGQAFSAHENGLSG